ncbi:MAG: DUF4215 domain-containing protein, partial [Bdellovibrionales bacterium]|nr:DUF4215 domain-containing protein [Bdellovibrionales bacterium]
MKLIVLRVTGIFLLLATCAHNAFAQQSEPALLQGAPSLFQQAKVAITEKSFCDFSKGTGQIVNLAGTPISMGQALKAKREKRRRIANRLRKSDSVDRKEKLSRRLKKARSGLKELRESLASCQKSQSLSEYLSSAKSLACIKPVLSGPLEVNFSNYELSNGSYSVEFSGENFSSSGPDFGETVLAASSNEKDYFILPDTEVVSSTGIKLSVAKEFAVEIGLTMVAATKGVESGIYCVSEILPVSFKAASTEEGFCGDGEIQQSLGEQCDDGNNLSGDGCSSSCKEELPLSDSINISLKVTRTSGVAPLAVHFDAADTTGTTNSPFRDLIYSWDFGDPNSGVWSTNGKSRNSASGPVSGHLYNDPGTYKAKVSVVDQFGNYNEKEIEITVTDANSFFAGTKTTCISTSANFSGCPSGSQTVTTSSFNTAMNYFDTGKRVLFRRGETFNSTGASRGPTGTAEIS